MYNISLNRLLAYLLLLAMFFNVAPVYAQEKSEGTGVPDGTREQILDIMAANPDDAALQQQGKSLLEAMDAWTDQVRRSEAGSTVPFATEQVEMAAQEPGQVVPADAEEPLPTPLAGLDLWNLNENYITASVADIDWTANEDLYAGTKLGLSGQYSFFRGKAKTEVPDCNCPQPPVPHRLMGTVGFDLLWGDEDLEYSNLSVAGLTYQRNWFLENGRFDPIRDTLEWGVLTVGHNDHLGIDSYTELTVARAGRTWGWRRSDSGWMLTAGVGLSGGWAWAESVNPLYDDVSNPFAGSWVSLGMAHHRWGKIHIEQRVIQGFTLSNPSEGDSTSREALFRAAYAVDLPACFSGEIAIEKGSFAFSNFNLSDLYEKSRRVNLAVGCIW